jgi:hypothetical protein
MSFCRFLVLPLLVVVAFLLTSVLRTNPAHSSRSAASEVPAPDPTAPAAARTLDLALAALDSSRVPWLKAAVWQKTSAQGHSYEAEGHYLAGPDHRVRLELVTRHGAARSTQLLVSDGSTLWRASRTGEGDWTDACRVDLQKVLQVLDAEGAPAQVRDEFLDGQLFGVAPLLRTLRQRVSWVRRETVRRGGHTFLKLTGSWSADNSRASPDQPCPDCQPRLCRLYLEPTTLWPHRIEWWGEDPPRPGNVLLVQTEFRSPVLNHPLSTQECARAFVCPVAPHLVSDMTLDTTERLRTRPAAP